MSLLAVAEQTLADAETAAVADAKGLLSYIDNIIVIDIEPALATVLKNAIGVLGQEAVTALLGNALPASAPPAAS